jgi:hypothetical protein
VQPHAQHICLGLGFRVDLGRLFHSLVVACNLFILVDGVHGKGTKCDEQQR